MKRELSGGITSTKRFAGKSDFSAKQVYTTLLLLLLCLLMPQGANAAEITLWENVADGEVLSIDIFEAAGGLDTDNIKFYFKDNNYYYNGNGTDNHNGWGAGGLLAPSDGWYVDPLPYAFTCGGAEWTQTTTLSNIKTVAGSDNSVRVRFWENYELTKVTLVTADTYIYYENKSVTLDRFSEVSSSSNTPYNAVPQALTGSTSGVTYSIAKISDGLTANINSSTGVISNISGTAGGGAMVIKAQNSKYSAFYVVTVPFEAPHTWEIAATTYSNGKSVLLNADNYGAAFALEFEQASHNSSNQYTELKRGVYANAFEVNGDNYAYMDATAGLVVTAAKKKFGARALYPNELTWLNKLAFVDGTNLPDGLDSSDPDTKSQAIQTVRGYSVDVLREPMSMDLGIGSSFTIPKLKRGQYIRIWFSSQSRAHTGCQYAVSNATDLDGKEISGTFTHSGWLGDIGNVSHETGPVGSISFMVKEDGDVTFTSRNGWSWVSKIMITDDYWSELRIMEGPDWANSTGDNWVVDYNKPNGSMVVIKDKDGNPESLLHTYRNWSGSTRSRSQNAKNCDFTFENYGRNITYSFPTDDDLLWDTDRNGNKVYRIYPMTITGGTGNIKITQRALYGDDGENYVLDRNVRWIAVGEVNAQEYPYTWDFTEHNMSDDQFNYWNLFGHTVEANSYGKWSLVANNTKFDMQSCAKVKDPNERSIVKPLFAQGSELVYASENGPVTMAEFKGLGITFATPGEEWMDDEGNPEKYVTIMGNGQGYLSGVKEIMVPYVKNGQKVYIQTTDNNVSITLDDANGNATAEAVAKSGAKGWTVSTSETNGTHVRIALDPTKTVYRVAVTDIEKTINQYGYATESRDCPIDHAITSEFVAGEPKAYYMKGFSEEGAEGNKIGVVQMVEASDNKGITINHDEAADHYFSTIPAETGIVIYASGASNVTIPLFVPAINVLNKKGATNLDGNLLMPSVVSASVSGANGDYILTNIYNHKGSAEKNYGDIGYYYSKAGTLGANKSYLHLDKSSPAKAVFIMTPFDEDDNSGETTGISKLEESSSSDSYYTLDGLKVIGKPSAKGMYIKNGKKYVVK